MKSFVFIPLFAASLVFTLTSRADARSQQDQPYPSHAVWSAAVRFLRVDLRLPVLEKDKEAGYILFDFVQDTKVYKASLELMPFEESSGRAATRVIVSVPDLPRHVEGVLLDKLARKLKEELGAPAPPPSRPKPEKDGAGDTGERRNGSKKKEPADEDPNAPERGADGLPRLPTRELPRPQD